MAYTIITVFKHSTNNYFQFTSVIEKVFVFSLRSLKVLKLIPWRY